MTDEQWEKLLAVLSGELIQPLAVGFIVDGPWLCDWAGISILDYFTSEQLWFETNLKAINKFPDVLFLPGFWSEFGMCTEPSAFGTKCRWYENEAPFASKVITDIRQVDTIAKPNPQTDGLLPFVLNRLKRTQAKILQEGHSIKFAISRGPLNIASFVADCTEFLTAIRTDPDEAHKLLETVTDFIIDWLKLQAQTFPSIDGVLILDDIVGFLGEQDFKKMVLPYLERIFQSLDVSVRFFHNDAAGLICAPYLPKIGVNLFNFSFQHTLAEMKKLTNNTITLLGNIPPRDVLSAGKPEDIYDSVKAALESVEDKTRIILSCGGAVPPGVPTENIRAFLSAAGYS